MPHLTQEEFLSKCRDAHGNRYSYSKATYLGCSHKVCVTCLEHGDFWQGAQTHWNGKGCPKCWNERRGETQRLTTEGFRKKAVGIHGNKYDYSKVRYSNSCAKVEIICSKHGKFLQSPNHHLKGKGCPGCWSERRGEALKLTTESFIQKARAVHGDRYAYPGVKYVDNTTKVPITCPKHGVFFQEPQNHLNAHGCPRCTHKYSWVEQRWLTSLGIPEEYWQYRIPGTRYTADGYDPKTNTVYEFDGDYFHGNPEYYAPQDVNQVRGQTFGELYQSTLAKRSALRNLGYQLVWVWESAFIGQERPLSK